MDGSPPAPFYGVSGTFTSGLSLSAAAGTKTRVRSGESVQSRLSNTPPSSPSSPPPIELAPTITTRKAVGGSDEIHAASLDTPSPPST